MSEVVAVHRSAVHAFSKDTVESVRLLEGLGVEGDAHAGATVKHRSRVRRDPTQPNLRQVHLIHEELLAETRAHGYDVAPGALGENITTRGVDLLELPRDARLHLGPTAVVRITGLRNPCSQIDDFQPGLLNVVLEKRPDGDVVRKTGVMGVVEAGGEVRPGDEIRVELPPEPHARLERV